MEGAKVRMTPKECKRLADVDFHIAVVLKSVNEPSSMVVAQFEILRRIHRCRPDPHPSPSPRGRGVLASPSVFFSLSPGGRGLG